MYIKTIANCMLIAFTFSGCGGGGGSSSPKTQTGYFVDAPVEGLSYECSSGAEGTTDSTGTFTCNKGDTITFKIGGTTLGSTIVSDVITPFHLYPTDSEKAYNVSQLLHSLDNDSNPDNNITLLNTFNMTNVDVSTDSDTFQNALASALASYSRSNYNRNSAKAKMLSYIQNNSDTNYGLSLDIDSELSLLETLMCSAGENLTNGTCSTKISEGDIDALYYAYRDIKNKSDYETDLEYATRISDFIESQGVLTFTIKIKDKYDIDTQTLEVYSYGSPGYVVDSQFIYGHLQDDRDYLQIYNYRDFSSDFDITHTPTQLSERDAPDMTYYKTTMAPQEAESLHDKFYAKVKVKPKIMVEFPDSSADKEIVYTSCGTLYCTSSLYVDLVSIEVYNSTNDTLYAQATISQ